MISCSRIGKRGLKRRDFLLQFLDHGREPFIIPLILIGEFLARGAAFFDRRFFLFRRLGGRFLRLLFHADIVAVSAGIFARAAAFLDHDGGGHELIEEFAVMAHDNQGPVIA